MLDFCSANSTHSLKAVAFRQFETSKIRPLRAHDHLLCFEMERCTAQRGAGIQGFVGTSLANSRILATGLYMQGLPCLPSLPDFSWCTAKSESANGLAWSA